MYKAILFSLLLLMSACSSKTPTTDFENELWPYELYNKFNLRTIVSSYSNHLKYYCASYPKDFFRPDQLFMPNTKKIVIQNKTRFLSFELVARDHVIIVDVIEGSYKAQHLYKLYYNEEFDDYRADTFFIDEKENCVKFVIPDDENVSK